MTTRFILCILLFVIPSIAVPTLAQETTDSTRKHPWWAAAEVTAVNGLIMAYDHLVIREPWYRVTMKDIKENVQLRNWWWDTDYYHTNAINHPYHGSLFYTAARDNGMTIGESSLYALAGSLVWEVFCESEHPSINDLVTTAVGGIALGEPMHRISDGILDNRKRGLERIGRELMAFAVNPVKGVNRIIRGDSWRVSSSPDSKPSNIKGGLEIGYGRQDIHNKSAINTAYANINITYGDMMGTVGRRPFDYFTLNFTAVTGSSQPHINLVQVKSQLWCRPLSEEDQAVQTVFGIYHHYDYSSATPEYHLSKGASYMHPYGYLEIGSVGPGFGYRCGHQTRWEQQLFVNGIALGATPTDCKHPANARDRGYSFGSGYGARLSSTLEIGDWFAARINSSFSQLFCWDGFYADDPDRKMTSAGYSVQGDEGNAVTLIAEPSIEITPFRHFGIGIHGRYFWCHSNYKYHPHATTNSWELRAGARYSF